MVTTFVLTHKSASLRLTQWDNVRASLYCLRSIEKRKGHASKLLQDLSTFCDDRGLVVLLEVDAYDKDGMNNSQLKAFYEKFGFKVVDDKEEPIVMERNPK